MYISVRLCLAVYGYVSLYTAIYISMYSCVLTILGVTIDDKLTFSEHIKDISKRASQKVGVLQRLRNLIPCSAKLQLY